MPKIHTLLMVLLFPLVALTQQNDDAYEVLWQKVQKLEREALTKSALKIVQTISEKAHREKNPEQKIKALLYTSKYSMTLEEDAQLKIIHDFRMEIEKAEFPVKNVLESYLANLYWQYFQQHRHQFYQRTATTTLIDSADFRTWDLTSLFHKINEHFEASLDHPKRLQEQNLDSFRNILTQQPNSEDFRPTLFDILAHNALTFYKTEETSVNQPSDRFEIDDPKYLCEAYDFIQLNLPAQDENLLQSKALLTYQKLLQFHFSDPQLEAFVDVDIDRLNYTHQNAVFEDKDDRLLETLHNSAKNLRHNEVSGLYEYEIARLFHQQGNTYDPQTNEQNQWKQREALQLCESVIARFPNSRAANKCMALKSEILAPSIEVKVENFVPTNTVSRMLVSYKNHSKLQLIAYEITPDQWKQLMKTYPPSKQLAFIETLPTVTNWAAELKDENDYQNHRTEIQVPKLPNGQYLILATPLDSTKGKASANTFAFGQLQVTNMALIATQTESRYNFQVVDRRDGAPVPGAILNFSYLKNYNKPYVSKKMISDDMGQVSIPLPEANWSDVSVEVSNGDESAYFENYYVNQRYDKAPTKIEYSCFLFTDRSIYRPGQTVYFKGIAIQKTNRTSSILDDTEVLVALHDVNGQVISSQKFTTNAYGSFSGEFIVPRAGLSGNFSIQASAKELALHGYSSFSVEEYKRPKFATTFEPVKEGYKIGDSITEHGNAMGYAGSAISNASVSYRVRRVVIFPWWYDWRPSAFQGSPQEIAYGKTKTDDSGGYEITFKAIPDKSVSKENLPTFQYEIIADVTDINGETHSTSTIINVGYHTLKASINVPDRIDKTKTSHIVEVNTRNLNGQFVPARGTLKMFKLKAPDYVLRQRPWPSPDYKGWPEKEFKALFPHDAFDQEDNVASWGKEKLVWQRDFDTQNSTKIELQNLKKWDSGKYLIVVETADKFGQKIIEKALVTLYGDNDTRIADNQLFQITTDKERYDIGDKVEVTLSSAAKNLYVTVITEKNKQITEARIVYLSENVKTLKIPVTENDLGGFSVHYSFSAFNSFQSGSLSISVPYPTSKLHIETMTFRDKLRPGEEETWAFKVKGPKGEKVTAELLASMYDTSLDAFRPHVYSFEPLFRANYYSSFFSHAQNSFGIESFRTYQDPESYSIKPQLYDSFNWFGFYFGRQPIRFQSTGLVRKQAAPMANAASMDMEVNKDEVAEESLQGNLAGVEVLEVEDKSTEALKNKNGFEDIQVRKNLQETAFFFPKLMTDNEGNVSFTFTSPEALTEWKLQLLAYTKSLESAVSTFTSVTQKELMIVPNVPRFLREGDEITISSKISNLTTKSLSGTAQLMLENGLTGEDVGALLITGQGLQKEFSIDAMGNTQVSWRLHIPKDLRALQYKIVAKAGEFSDGEQNLLPVLTNRMLVTETLPIWVRSDQTKTFTLDKLKDMSSHTLNHHQLTLEITTNPAWYAVQALPYLMEYPYDCNEQIFARYYSNTLATHIANSNPRIQQVFEQWANSDALISNLEKNEELKSLLIQETPWLRDAESEAEQKKRIALLFDLNKMKNERLSALLSLKNNQKPSGAWAWFKGGPDNRFITQHVVAGLGHLKKLNINSAVLSDQTEIIQNAIAYLDSEFTNEYDRMKKYSSNLEEDHLSQTQIHYLYMRSFFKDIKTSEKVQEITKYYQNQAQTYWMKKGLYAKGMLALILYRMNDRETATKILRSLKENSIISDEIGMYWKENTASWQWHQAPIETQALMIEAFGEIQNDIETIDNLKIWLLKNKQTSHWKTTKATTEAIYALLLQGSDWLSFTEAVDVLVGGKKIEPSELENVKVEAGTGYFKTSWGPKDIKPTMATVQLTQKGKGMAWGALYWQYFEDMDKITSSETPLQLKKNLFLKKNTDTGEKITEITSRTTLKVGDLVRVRIEIRSDRDMEYIHMKDMRAAGFEPVNVLSQYKWQDGLGYYESTKDASTHFFFDYLPKGVYVFEYDLRVNNAGAFSNGITTIENMYAPEFNSHSEGEKVLVGN
ncbi:alpha-2-macroglobulin family protein [Pareuzebyella sediminis]|uniref:alpha-2-macroglobulin family protein n=1 Tax=Pareuzebyella sediminis TaxID=2607998 RepID=UPI0011EEE2EB|nr:MG2 domain-containing protein [Pareuzebyella sediminis]